MGIVKSRDIAPATVVVDTFDLTTFSLLWCFTSVFAFTSSLLFRDLIGRGSSAITGLIFLGHAAGAATLSALATNLLLNSFRLRYDAGSGIYEVNYRIFAGRNSSGDQGEFDHISMRLDRKTHGRRRHRERWVLELTWKDALRRPLELASIRRRYGAPLFDRSHRRASSTGFEIAQLLGIEFECPHPG